MEYLTAKTELQAVIATLQLKRAKAIQRNKEKPTQTLADLISELDQMVSYLENVLMVFAKTNISLGQSLRENTQLSLDNKNLNLQNTEIKDKYEKLLKNSAEKF